MKICYEPKTFNVKSMEVIEKANEIIETYRAQGFDLTLRQLYYQFVSRDLIPNQDKEYKRLVAVINDARLAGMVDWDAIVDRTRYVRENSHWADPSSIIDSAAYSYAIDKWQGQPYRVEVWIEKDALIGVIEGVCKELDCPFFSCRGYTSASEMWAAGRRLQRYLRLNQTPVILHLGDHDPSGKDMTRDIQERLELFLRVDLGVDQVDVRRIALNMDQVDAYSPPPNPAKITDSRAQTYIAEFGNNSWELDALEPGVLVELIRTEVRSLRDNKLWNQQVRRERAERKSLEAVADRWGDVQTFLEGA